MTMYKVLHPKDDIDRLYVSRKEGGRGLICIQDRVDVSVRLKDHVKSVEEDWLQTPETIQAIQTSTEQK